MTLALLGIATALAIAFAACALRTGRRPRPRAASRAQNDHVEELVLLDLGADGALDGDFDPSEDG